MLFQVPELDAADLRVLEEIEEFRDQFRHRLAEPRRWQGQLRRSLSAAAIRGSNTIEGYTISVDDAMALASGEQMSAEADGDTRAAVEGYKDALTYVQQAAHFAAFRYEEMLLSVLHFMLVKHHLDQWPGRYRPGGIWVSGGAGQPPVYEGPGADEVAELMTELIDWLNNGDRDASPYVRAALAHLNLVSIHPWRDGNGRMSRCLHTLVLAREQVLAPEFSSIEEWLGMSEINTLEYYAALRKTQKGTFSPGNDTHHWVRFSLRAHHLQAQGVQRRFEFAAQLWARMDEAATRNRLPERTIAALYAAAQGHLRRATYATDEDLTRDVSVRDIQQLQRMGLIVPVGHARTRRYVGSPELQAIATEVHDQVTTQFLREPYPSD
ncbi:Fic family protein [Nocardia camponoti]|uniref:Cell filamentation protein Fic n=1 Tax=Nocardia camponoti TaxID=1616106 RepID=A0A917QM20_9NOCA|nr:Fic family protein [Nocardia camponoti]GGK56607.1 cell filamentation protein Fic [Nocardia camponoti]